MDIVWLLGFGLLCAGISGLTWACGRAVPTHAASRSADMGATK